MTENYKWFTRITLLRVAFILVFSLLAGGGFAQTRAISGTVKDALGPVPGASVTVEGTTIGASTDIDGRFTLNVPTSAKQLLVSFIGYADTYIDLVAAKTEYDVTL